MNHRWLPTGLVSFRSLFGPSWVFGPRITPNFFLNLTALNKDMFSFLCLYFIWCKAVSLKTMWMNIIKDILILPGLVSLREVCYCNKVSFIFLKNISRNSLCPCVISYWMHSIGNVVKIWRNHESLALFQMLKECNNERCLCLGEVKSFCLNQNCCFKENKRGSVWKRNDVNTIL